MIGRYKHVGVYQEIVTSKDFFRIILAIFCIVFAVSMEKFSIFSRFEYSFLTRPLIADILLLAAACLTGVPIIREAIQGLLKRQINVDELVSMAIMGCVATGNYLEAAIVSTIMVAGGLVEEAVSDSARNAIRHLIAMTPEQAIILRDGEEIEVNVKDVQPGELLLVRPGETIPVDAVIESGEASIDESSITGESIPVAKSKNAMVYAGTINFDGYLKVRVTSVGKDSTIGKIITLVEAAERSKTGSARLVDRYAKWFTPVILGLAIFAYLITRDITRAITVLIVGCPCSFLLSGPVPTIASIGRAAKSGIMIKGGCFLEEIARSSAIYFDKTGTLTHGVPRVTVVEPTNGYHQRELIRLAASIEQACLHPIARAIVAHAAALGCQLSEAQQVAVIAGTGIEGKSDGCRIVIGAASTEKTNGETVVEVVVNGASAGYITLIDSVRKRARQTIAQLRKLGIQNISVISGDAQTAVEKVAAEIGIDTYHARLTPAAKYQQIESHRNGPVVYVGDGINDAPALKKAAVGIAMGGRGSDIALETADIVLMNDRLDLLPFLIVLGRRMIRTIHLNILLSITINLFSIWAAFAGVLTPTMGAISHNLGSILVVMLSALLALQQEESLEENAEEEVYGESRTIIEYPG